MKASAIYRKAAEMIDDGSCIYSCCAIDKSVLGHQYDVQFDWTALTETYEHWFANNGTMNAILISPFANCDDPRLVRVLALLFMSEIAKDEE